MGTRDDRPTVEFDREQLARLARQATADPADSAAPEVPQEETPSSPRTQTLQDPMTMALLAEVARSSRTRDFDAETLAEAEAAEPVPELAHPHLKKR